jgi:hypothetical protein
MTAARTAAIALAALIFGPAFVMLVWAFAVSSRETYRNFMRWRRAVRRNRRQPTGAGIGAAG